jgi:SAM-dependent methyltransferase
MGVAKNNFCPIPYDMTSYDAEFYNRISDRSYRSARKYAEVVAPILKPSAVIDVGCGRGAWLLAFHEFGAERLVGIDGAWNSRADMLDQCIEFSAVDLDQPAAITLDARFDLALCLEVAEHLQPASADDLVELLIRSSSAVLFSAAFTGQTGRGHINEQPHTYWAEKFIARGYRPFDLFRSRFWGATDVECWYQQNAFLYVRQGCESERRLLATGYAPLENLAFMDCIHPTIYHNALYWRAKYRPPPQGLRQNLNAMRESFWNAAAAVAPAIQRRLFQVKTKG